ncbi:hypothetical protein [Selenomonas ruminis]|uniref:Uncharacterized protein n=1 Tax=Selenomonas ruminis TaxID=2593411 RepID=A0A5D6W1E5_9FIRM|nr:hypothetical protein [Selenomonas sp. mPRGC5]TYZ20959.1 hypothetical protein FZ040_11130 [Selenomonas sp. mPRGC5]
MTNLKINKPILFLSISVTILAKGMDKYINEKLLWGFLLILFISLAIYYWKKFHQKIIILSFGLFGITCLIGLFWHTNTPYDGVTKGALILWSAFGALASIVVNKMSECNGADKKLLKLIISFTGGSLLLLCALVYIPFLIK